MFLHFLGYPLYSKSDCSELQMETGVRTDVVTKIDQYHFSKQPYCIDEEYVTALFVNQSLPNFLGKTTTYNWFCKNGQHSK